MKVKTFTESETQYEYDQRGKRIFEGFIRALRPDAHCSWEYHPKIHDIHEVSIRCPGRKRIELDITDNAFTQALDDPDRRPRLELEVKRQLQVSESGKIGCVKEI